MVPKVTVAVIGGTGLLGKYLVHGFLDDGHYDVTILTRQGGDPAKLAPFIAKGAKALTVDFADQASLIASLEGIDILVSAVGAAALADQPKYIEAAKAAGVKRFVPSEFGMDPGAPGIREYLPLFRPKFATRDAVEASGLEWTYVVTGFFVETTFTSGFAWDVPGGKVTIKGNPDAPFTLTSLVDVGKWTAEALRDPVSKNATVYLKGDTITFNKAVKRVEGVIGKKLVVHYVGKAELDAEIAAAGSPAAAFFNIRLRAIADGWVDTPPAGVPPYRGPADASQTLESYAKLGKWEWADA